MDTLIANSAEVAGISTLVKLVVDVIKAYAPDDLQPWILPMTALALGLVFAFLLVASQDETIWTMATFATTVLRGVLGGIGAVVVTDVHKMVRGQK